MSFASEVKNDLCRLATAKNCCKRAELDAFLLLNGSLHLGLGNNLSLSMQTEHGRTARRMFTLAKEIYNINTELMVHRKDKLKKNQVYSLLMPAQEGVRRALADLGFSEEGMLQGELELRPAEAVWRNNCCRRAFLRGAFLASGSISDPQSSYHMEIVCSALSQAEFLNSLLAGFELQGGVVQRKQSYVLYLKESEQIIVFLTLIGAHRAVLNLENVRISKEIRNNVQRVINAETANINKTVDAAQQQLAAIRRLEQHPGLSKLSAPLREAAEMRIEYPEASLAELAGLLGIGKSGANHRMRKLMELAAVYEEEEPARDDGRGTGRER